MSNPNPSSALDADISTHHSRAPHTQDAPTSHIAKLPPELHLRILAEVPARDVQKCRRLDRYFQSLIDDKPNHRLCTGPSVSRSLKRLREQVVEFSDFPLDPINENGLPTGFLTALARFINFHGIPLAAGEEVHGNTIAFFALHWYHQWHKIPDPEPRTSSPEQASMAADFIAFAWNIVLQHVRVHASSTPRSQEDILEAVAILAGSFMDGAMETIGIRTEKQFGDLMGEIFLPSGVFSGVTFHEQYTPKQIEHCLLYTLPGHKLISRAHVLRRLNRMLDIPFLPWCTPAGLFVASEWAVEEVKNLLGSREPCGHVKKAALLEDMFLDWDPQIGEATTRSPDVTAESAAASND
ncbi:uncharacterized protein MYCFIDRAFT_193968 [Pseudocercospora fijiensis CIRAD86]|uniref:F-box domain-containing protein n=1 Tax=Pseudocercospora fijiensis (strain CIRAD86) TaxID=383855 RepID=M2Z7I1_PSEFD|nr:uncharacterized protein MYCFIDRAFT_193968 [Pseudocercospora fijiensis CIRAD86]EME85730.1 hypothetical protein MYCFIDRAFT_193968 [Pseudocercospora fijiensis CIRAD86]